MILLFIYKILSAEDSPDVGSLLLYGHVGWMLLNGTGVGCEGI